MTNLHLCYHESETFGSHKFDFISAAKCGKKKEVKALQGLFNQSVPGGPGLGGIIL
ncbi:MAG: hypothetical protein ACFE95_00275 [Candidatus Hodarchaeota archaeon]